MKKNVIILLLLLFSFGLSAQNMEVNIVKPLKYEKRDGQVKVLSYVKLNQTVKGNLSLKLDNKDLNITETAASDSILVWLPMIGQTNVLKVFSNGTQIDNIRIQAPVSSDWGYFKNGSVSIIQSSHQDIAWMDTPAKCRQDRIDNICTPALNIMQKDTNFRFEMEQTLNLMEYLDAHPERKVEVEKRLKEDRFGWGATFNQCYEGLQSGEQLVRQVYYGRKWIKENLPGCDDVTANNMDVPGRAMQMPQILAKGGVKNLAISRIQEGLFNWYSPDGSKIFTYSPGNYGWGIMDHTWAFFNYGLLEAFQRVHKRIMLNCTYFKEHNIPPYYAVLLSCDATKPNNYDSLATEWNKIVELSGMNIPHLIISSSRTYCEKVNVATANLKKVYGERPNLWLYIHGPAHYEQTLAKREAGISLPAAEMYTTINNKALNNNWIYPRKAFDKAWMASIYPDHGLGGNHGDITDKIYGDTLRYAQKVGSTLLNKALNNITNDVKTNVGNYVVYNDLTWDRSGVAYYEIGKNNVKIKDADGNVISSQVVIKGDKRYLAFMVKNVPSVGYKTYKVSKTGKIISTNTPDNIEQGCNYYENKYYKVVLGNGGITSLFDKKLNREIVQTEKMVCGDILEVGYTGNGAGEFNRVKDVSHRDLLKLSTLNSNWKIVQTGALFTVFENKVPTKNAEIIQDVKIYHSIKKIDFDITLKDFNGAHNRQYRIAFPLKMDIDNSSINYEVPMGVLKVGRDEMKTIPGGMSYSESYTFRPEDTHPREVQNFISSNGEGFGFTMSSCVAVADWLDPSVDQAVYPVMQGILLSSHHSCHGAGNWYAQNGTHHFHFSILSHNEGWRNGYEFGVESNHPFLVVEKQNRKGKIASQKSFISISNSLVALTAFKKTDADNSVIIRLVEMEGKDKDVTVTLPFYAKQVIKTNIIEEEETFLNVKGHQIKLHLGHNAIETYKIKF